MGDTVKGTSKRKRGVTPDFGGEQGVSQLIHSAERFIGLNKYDQALAQISIAQSLDPGNKYLQAIVYRIQGLRAEFQNKQPGADTGFSDGRYLSPTIGNEFPTGIKESLPTPEIQHEIRHLTSVAESFLDKGSPERAFDSLMKAYLLDPVSPYVIACEKAVLPAWTKVKQSQRNASAPVSSDTPMQAQSLKMDSESMIMTNHEKKPEQPLPESTNGASSPLSPEQRLELLKRQKLHERQERERAILREPAKKAGGFGEDELGLSLGIPPSTAAKPKEETGLFGKLKRGKFLG